MIQQGIWFFRMICVDWWRFMIGDDFCEFWLVQQKFHELPCPFGWQQFSRCMQAAWIFMDFPWFAWIFSKFLCDGTDFIDFSWFAWIFSKFLCDGCRWEVSQTAKPIRTWETERYWETCLENIFCDLLRSLFFWGLSWNVLEMTELNWLNMI